MIPKLSKLRLRVAISFSGGKTSAYMAQRLTAYLRDLEAVNDLLQIEIVTIFANTSQEHEKTLEYVRNCDQHFGLNVVWVEGVYNARGVGTSHRVVTFETAKRKGEVFEEMIKKYGLPNSGLPFCTRELKRYPIYHYLKSIGWTKGNFLMAIGIRADEGDRMSEAGLVDGLFYPLVHWGVTKPDVLAWDLNNPFQLGLPEHYGNCVWCWKKSNRKLATLAMEAPQVFEFPTRMQNLYKDMKEIKDRRMFRGRQTFEDFLAISQQPGFVPYQDQHVPAFDPSLDVGSGCSESCEVFADKE